MGKSSSQASRKRRELKNNNGDNNSNKTKKSKTIMEAEKGGESPERLRLSEVVSDCIERWFEDTLKEAKSGDVNMQVLVGQMYYSGYGVPKDTDKGKFWIKRASRMRSSVWKVSNKRPGIMKLVILAGYNASDSDSDEVAGGS
ncbi:hypothetical protein BUALT_Bualt09G0132300 [Buddleja alternifolia]|uniref:Sel1-like protein n=1 Tax=Buddleja alternifolia TaxID=168488 RepID=A0AAV6X2P7_9LAMI|nr:hypothetical protein BUALT_Bualt09G0132300 [Buddleja alternifolia]